jgi:hypothetical protein
VTCPGHQAPVSMSSFNLQNNLARGQILGSSRRQCWLTSQAQCRFTAGLSAAKTVRLCTSLTAHTDHTHVALNAGSPFEWPTKYSVIEHSSRQVTPISLRRHINPHHFLKLADPCNKFPDRPPIRLGFADSWYLANANLGDGDIGKRTLDPSDSMSAAARPKRWGVFR